MVQPVTLVFWAPMPVTFLGLVTLAVSLTVLQLESFDLIRSTSFPAALVSFMVSTTSFKPKKFLPLSGKQINPRGLRLGLLGSPVHAFALRSLKFVLRQLDLGRNPQLHFGSSRRKVANGEEAGLVATNRRRAVRHGSTAVTRSTSGTTLHSVDLFKSLGDCIDGDRACWLNSVDDIQHPAGSVDDDTMGLLLLAVDLHDHDAECLIANLADRAP